MGQLRLGGLPRWRQRRGFLRRGEPAPGRRGGGGIEEAALAESAALERSSARACGGGDLLAASGPPQPLDVELGAAAASPGTRVARRPAREKESGGLQGDGRPNEDLERRPCCDSGKGGVCEADLGGGEPGAHGNLGKMRTGWLASGIR